MSVWGEVESKDCSGSPFVARRIADNSLAIFVLKNKLMVHVLKRYQFCNVLCSNALNIRSFFLCFVFVEI